jgi:flagellar protein FlbT
MALKVELRPHERIIIGSCVITNTDQRARLLIEGERVPILREKDILTATTADTPAKRIYLAVQLMYTGEDQQAHHEVYFKLVRDIVMAAPSTWPIVEDINNHILKGDLYKALKDSRKLVEYEQELLGNAQRGESVRHSSEADRKSA